MHRKIVSFLCVLFITASYYEIGDDGSYESEVIIVVIVVISLLAFLLPSSFRIGHLNLYLDLPSLRPLPLHLLSFCLQHLLNLVRLHSLYQPLVSLLPFSHFHTRQSLLLSLSFLLFRPFLMLNYVHLYLRISFHKMCCAYSKAKPTTPFRLEFRKVNVTFALPLGAVLSSLLSPNNLFSLLSCRFQILHSYTL